MQKLFISALFAYAAFVGSSQAGDANLDGRVDANDFSFGVEREMKESGEKGGTQDINIGVGELQENTSYGDDGKKGGNAETTWKVEKGEK